MRKFILFLSLFFTHFIHSQINFNFTVSAIPGGSVSQSAICSSAPWSSVLTFDLAQFGVCEGQDIMILNNSYGSISGSSITNATNWDLANGNLVVPQSGSPIWSVSSYVLGPQDNPGQADLWNPNPLIVNFPASLSSAPSTVTHTMIVAPNLLSTFFGVHTTTLACQNAILLKIIVKKAPLCITDMKLCDTNLLTNSTLGIGAGVTATNWFPSDPRVTTPVEGNYTVTLSNGNCTVNCSFDVEFIKPYQDIIVDQVVCSDALPYSSQYIYDSNPINISVNGVIILQDYNIVDPSYFNSSADSLVFNSPGNYEIVYNFSIDENGESVDCSKTYNLTISAPIDFAQVPTTVFMCNDNLEICGPTSPNGSNYSYAWYGPSSSGNQSVLLSTDECYMLQTVGGYNLVVTDENGCTANHTFTVTNELPTVELGHDIIICDNDYSTIPLISISNQGFDNSNFVITWYQNGSVIQNGGTVLQVTPTSGTISVVVSLPGSGCHSQIDQIEIINKVCCPEDVNIGIILCQGEEPIFHVLNQGFDNPNIQITWYFQGQIIQNGGEILETSVYGDGELSVSISKEGCPKVSDSISLSCPDTRPTPCFKFVNPISQFTRNSFYGPMTINTFCAGKDVFIDGSCSTNENGYHLRISEFNLTTWSFITDLYNGWVSGTGSAPASINLSALAGPFTPGKIYLVSLSIGSVWASAPPQFFTVVDCPRNRSESIVTNEKPNSFNLEIYPNPTKDTLNFIFEKISAGKIDIYSLEGKLIFSKEFEDEKQLEASLSDYSKGIYIAKVTIGNETITKKIIKE